MFNISLLQRTFNSRTYSCRRKTTINLASTDTKNSYACPVITTTTTKSQYSRTIIHTNAKWCNNVKEGPVSAARWRLRADGGLDWPGGASSSGWRNPAGLKRCWIQILQSSLRKATNSRQKNQSARTCPSSASEEQFGILHFSQQVDAVRMFVFENLLPSISCSHSIFAGS